MSQNDSPKPLRVGGQALPDGVLMRTDRAWAVARRDGSVETGTLPAPRWPKVPVLRVLVSLVPALQLGLGLRTGAAGRGHKSRPAWPLIRALVLTEGCVIAIDALAAHAGIPGSAAPLVIAMMWIGGLVAFRLVSPAAQWRYHGAEHKAVAAFEQGRDLRDLGAVLACSRIHPRCGSNVVVWVAVAAPLVTRTPLYVQLLAFPLLLGVVAELMTVAGQHRSSILGRLVLAPGYLLQRAITTKEPLRAEQQIGCSALLACLAVHEAQAGMLVVAQSVV